MSKTIAPSHTIAVGALVWAAGTTENEDDPIDAAVAAVMPRVYEMLGVPDARALFSRAVTLWMHRTGFTAREFIRASDAVLEMPRSTPQGDSLMAQREFKMNLRRLSQMADVPALRAVANAELVRAENAEDTLAQMGVIPWSERSIALLRSTRTVMRRKTKRVRGDRPEGRVSDTALMEDAFVTGMAGALCQMLAALCPPQ